jgi:CheY-like chemotaxis protein
VSEIGILIVDDDVSSQNALKSVLDSEGWLVRIVTDARQALAELATGAWTLAIVNVAVADVNGPLFAILRELSDAGEHSRDGETPESRKRLCVLFLVPARMAAAVQPILEREELPYSVKPYHLHEFFEKVSDLLVGSGAIEEPIRTIGNFGSKRGPARKRSGRHSRRGAMFASREDYQMTEEELVEYERQEEEDRKKREKERQDREHL